jgi:uncharacterized iron-regulated membrane protein
MSTALYRWLRTFHAWAGAILALLVILISVSGTLLVWKKDYVVLTTPAAQVPFAPTPEIFAIIAAAVEARYGAQVQLIEFPQAGFPLTKVHLTDTRYAYLDVHNNVVDEWVQNERWEEWLYDLHHRLLLGNTGLTLVGYASLLAMLLVISGVILFWPLRRGLRQGLWPSDGTRPRLLISHRNLGIIMALPLLLTLVTAALLAFPEQSARLLLEPFRGEDYSMDFAENLDDVSGGSSGAWPAVMQRAATAFPGASIRSAQVPDAFSSYRIVGLQQAGELHPQGLSKVYIDADGGWMDIRIDMQAQHISERIYNTAYPLHTGRFDNRLYKLLLTINGFFIATLATLGLLAFVRKTRG